MATNRSICQYDEKYIETLEKREMWLAWYIVAPVHYILGTPGHLILFISFYRKHKDDRAYMYQVFATVSEFLELQFWTMLVLAVHFLSGSEGDTVGVIWYRKCYVCMWYAAKLAHATFSSLFTCSLLFSIAMTADRLFATAYPFRYKHTKQLTNQIIAVVACVAISAATGFADSLRYSVEKVGDMYQIEAKEADVENPLTVFMGHLRNVVRIIALLALIALNLALFHVVARKYKKVGANLRMRSEEEKKRRELEKMLLLLTICQSIFQGLSVLSSVAYFSALYGSAYFAMCIWGVFGPLMDIVIEVCDLGDLYFTFLINKQFKESFFVVFPCLKKTNATTTAAPTISISTTRVTVVRPAK